MTTPIPQGSVVVGVDRSPGSVAALNWATRYATSHRRPLVVVAAAGDPRQAIEYFGLAEARKMLLADAQEVANTALDTVHETAPDLETHASIPFQDARTALIEASEAASLVAVGTRGRGPVKTLLLGSVSTAVAAHASSPVAVVRPGGRRTDGSTGHVVVGIDAGPSSTSAMELAFQIASVDRLPLDVVFGWPSVDTYDDWHPYDQHLETHAEHRLALSESVAGLSEKYPDVHVTRLTPDLSPVQALVEQSNGASHVLVGTRGLTGTKAVFGSVSREVLERAHCTVLVVRPTAPQS